MSHGSLLMAGVSDGYFEIEARAAAPVTLDQYRLMVQALLANRFALKVHHETRKISVCALVVGKGRLNNYRLSRNC